MALVLALASAGVGGVLIATADWATTGQWCTVTVNGKLDGTDIRLGDIVSVRIQNGAPPAGDFDPLDVASENYVFPSGNQAVPLRLSATVPRWQEPIAHDAISQALEEIQRLLQAASPDVPGSDIHRLRQATADQRVPLSPEIVEMLHQAMKKSPLGVTPFEPGDDYAADTFDDYLYDLPPIARRYAIDKALDRMKSRGVTAGMIQIGDDIGRFGRQE